MLPLLGSLSAQIFPPINSTSCLEIVVPKPVPPNCLVIDPSAWVKESKILCRCFGEIPIPVPSGNGTIGIEYKKFGVGLSITPTILSNKTIALRVSPEVSDLDFSRGTSIQGILVPAILTRRANTTVELGENQSFVIGGLISRNIIANASQVPWLADIPILGAFFKGNTYSREDKELLIIVTPRFVKPRDSNAGKMALPGENVGMRPRGVWSQLFLPAADEPVPGFTSK